MIVREYTVREEIYSFNELSESAKETAKRAYLESFREVFDFTDICNCRLREDFPKSILEVQYSLSYCQGDGLNVYGSFHIADIIAFIKRIDGFKVFNKQEKRFIDFLEKQGIYIECKANSHYTYYTDKANIMYDCILDDFEGNYFSNIPYNTLRMVCSLFDDCFRKYCKEMENEGYSFFYEVEDDDIIATWEANEYLGFDKNGNPIYS